MSSRVRRQLAAPSAPDGPAHVRQESAARRRAEAALQAAAANLLAHLKEHPEQSLTEVAYTLQVGRQHFNQRQLVVCRSREEAIAFLEQGDLEVRAVAAVS